MKGRELSSGSNLKIYYKDEPELYWLSFHTGFVGRSFNREIWAQHHVKWKDNWVPVTRICS
jgi:hypothetical protein